MVKIKSFEFNLRELAGSMGDFGTLFPLAVGYIAVCGLDPCGLLVMMGIANIVTGIVYRIPMPIEPMKVLAVMAIAEKWTPSMVYASGFAMGVVWLFLGLTNVIGFIAKNTPLSVVRGIQIALGVLLAVPAITMMQGGWLLGLISILIIVLLRNSRWAPAAIVLMLMGLAVMYFKGDLTGLGALGVTLPSLTFFSAQDLLTTFVSGGLAQIPLTATNAVIATAALISQYFPDRPVSERKLATNMGVMNLVFPFFGGMPLCHGCGGLAGQYYFGARTGGTNIIEGVYRDLPGRFCGRLARAPVFPLPRGHHRGHDVPGGAGAGQVRPGHHVGPRYHPALGHRGPGRLYEHGNRVCGGPHRGPARLALLPQAGKGVGEPGDAVHGREGEGRYSMRKKGGR